jgi:GWxTD domain-containing protein
MVMAQRGSILVILAFCSVVLTAIQARAQDAPPDSLLVLADRQFFNGQTDSAATLYRRVLSGQATTARAAIGLGRIALLGDDTEDAESWFQRAEEWDPEQGHLEFGQGLLARARGETEEARSQFQYAYRRNRTYADALIEISHIQNEGLVERFAMKRTLRRAVEADPGHPSAYMELGKTLENQNDMDGAIENYENQIRINPESGEALMRLGFVLLERERYWHARQRLYQAIQITSGNELELSLAIAATYLGDRQFVQAHEAYAQAFAIMPDVQRANYESIALVGTPLEAQYDARVSGDQRLIFLQKFWLRRDPTPVTPVNERMLEHFRRVWYAMEKYGENQKPYDDRGTVYIRYGEPDHRGASNRPNYTVDPDVDAVRERYLHGIYGPTPPDVLARGSLPVYPLVNPDEYKNSANDTRFLGSFFDWNQRNEASDDEDVTNQSRRTETAGFGVETGLASLTRWEEWTYTSVGNGLQIMFVDRVGSGSHRFATPPMTSDLRMSSALRQYAPKEQYEQAARRIPERFVYDITQEPLNFYYYTSQFRAPENRTQLDVYYGLPTSELTFQSGPDGYSATVEAGVAVFDTLWNVLTRSEDRTKLLSAGRPTQERGAIHIDSRTIVMEGGHRILLSVQAEDATSGRLQAYRETVTIAEYDSSQLAMSDIVVAGLIEAVDSTRNQRFIRNGLSILPMASRAFRRNQPMHVYFEIYNLTRGAEFGATEYEIEYTVRAGGMGGSIFGSVGRILGGSQHSVGVGRIIEGISASEFQNFQIDISNLTSGDYTLLITVRDMKGDQSVNMSRVFSVGGN